MNLTIVYTSTICLSAFALVYLLLYRSSNRFTINRIYLLGTALMSSIIPFIHFNVFPKYLEINRKSSGKMIESTVATPLSIPIQTISTIELIYWIGVAFALSILIIRLILIVYKIKSNFVTQNGKYKIIKDNNASSFFNYLFLDDSDPVKQTHEEVHCNRLHSLDRILFGILICFSWFNPIIYIYRYLIIENHEFEADQRTIQALNLQKSTYGSILVASIKYSMPRSHISNQFNSLIKNRIKMLSNTTTRKISYLLLLPIIFGIFSAFTFKSYPVYIQENQTNTQDTLPGTITIIDTISYYDTETKGEGISIVKSEMSFDAYVKGIRFSNKYFVLYDTITVFDYDTLEEYISIVKVKMPEDLKAMYKNFSYDQTMSLYDDYAYQQTVKTTADKSGKILLFPSETGYFMTIFRDGKEIAKQRIPKLTKGIDVKDLNLQKGNYNIQRSDTKDIIILTVK